MNKPPEEWRPVTYNGIDWERYYVSNYGRVARVDKPRKISLDSHGYQLVSLSANGLRATAPVHHLVAEAFLGPRPPGHEVHHKDTERTHNWAWNLEYLSAEAHQIHDDHKYKRGEEVHSSKLTEEQIQEILDNPKISGAEFGRRFGVSRATVCDIRKGRTWKRRDDG